MPLPIPTLTDIYNQYKTNCFSNTNGSLQVERDPTLQAIGTALSISTVDLYKTLNYSIIQALFPSLSTDEAFILNMGIVDTQNKIQRKQAQFAKGKVIITATPQPTTITIPTNTEFSGNNNLSYKTTIQRECLEQKFMITNLTRQDNYSYATIPNHELANNLTIQIAGATQNSFNGSYSIELINANTIRYANVGINEVATGTILGSFYGAIVEIESIEPTINANLTNTDTLTISSNIQGIEETYISYSGIINGSDIEDILVFRDRISEFLGEPQNAGSAGQYKSYIKNKTNANYVYIFTEEDTTNIYIKFVLSVYDSNIDFTNYSNEALTEIKNTFIEDNQVILSADHINCLFYNPSFTNINISISNLSPNTSDMQTQIQKELKRYINLLPIKKYLSPNLTELSVDKIKDIIFKTRDSFGRNPTFSSASVSGALNLTTNISKPILGNITF